MSKPIPRLVFRIDPGYTFTEDIKSFRFSTNDILIGKLETSSDLECIFLGKIAEYSRNKKLWLDCDGAHAIYVMGKRRSGKTYTLGVITEGLASNNWIRQGDKKHAILLLDTMNVFVTMSNLVKETESEESEQVRGLEKWGLKSEHLNIVFFYPKGTSSPPEGISKEITIKPSDLNAQEWGALFGVDTYSDPIGQLISDIYEKVVLEGYEDSDGNRVNGKLDYSIEDILTCLDNCPNIENEYRPETIRAVKTRFRAIKRLSIFGDGVDIKEVFSPGQISILLLRDLDQDLRALLVGILVKKIMIFRSKSDKFERYAAVYKKKHEAFKEKGDIKKAEEALKKYDDYKTESLEGLSRGWVIIDEAHNYMPSRGIVPSAEPLKKYVNEGRNLGLSIVVATQNPSALDPSIRRNADISIIHSISMKNDVSAAEGIINTFVPDSFSFGREKISSRVFEKLLRSLPIGYAVISNDSVNRIFAVKIRPRITVHGGMEY